MAKSGHVILDKSSHVFAIFKRLHVPQSGSLDGWHGTGKDRGAMQSIRTIAFKQADVVTWVEPEGWIYICQETIVQFPLGW